MLRGLAPSGRVLHDGPHASIGSDGLWRRWRFSNWCRDQAVAEPAQAVASPRFLAFAACAVESGACGVLLRVVDACNVPDEKRMSIGVGRAEAATAGQSAFLCQNLVQPWPEHLQHMG